jgi:hypothetical protein
MKISGTFVLSAIFVTQCGVHRTASTEQATPPAKSSSAEAEKQRCDFSDYKPLTLRGTLGSQATSMPIPKYPPEAKEQKIAGRVTVKVLINVRSGVIERACAIQGDDLLRNAAEAAALKIKLRSYSNYIKEKYNYAEGVVIYNFLAQ